MDLRTLKYFVKVVECGNISTAAERLYMTQPPLSQQIGNLEKELGVPLLIRGPRKATLTEPGKLLYDKALAILELVEYTTKEIHSLNYDDKGTINIGIVTSCTESLLNFVKNYIVVSYPKISFMLTEKNTYELIELIKLNLIDGAIVRTPFDIDPKYNRADLFEDQIVAIGNKAFWEEEKEILSVQDLDKVPIILYRRWEPIITEAFKRHNMIPNYYCLNDNARTSLDWALNNLGVALVPLSVTQNVFREDIYIKPVNEEGFRTKVCFVWNSEKFISKAMLQFITSIKEYYSHLPSQNEIIETKAKAPDLVCTKADNPLYEEITPPPGIKP